MKFLLLLTFSLFNLIPQAQAVPALSAPQETVQKQESTAPSLLRPLQKQLIKWNILINREIPKRMKALKDNPSPAILFTSMLAALAYGLLHTLGPGHGKMVVASYFLTHGAHFWRGVFVGVQVAFSHVAGAVILVFVTDIAMRQLLADPTAQMFWLRSISYGLIILIGLVMLVQAVLHALGKSSGTTCGHCAHHSHDHGHTHHNHRSKREIFLSWCIGAVPCTGSLLILLYAMAHNILWLGLAMVACVALGMAITMTAIGWLCILGKSKLVDRYLNKSSSAHTWQIGLEIVGAITITALGALLLSAVFA